MGSCPGSATGWFPGEQQRGPCSQPLLRNLTAEHGSGVGSHANNCVVPADPCPVETDQCLHLLPSAIQGWGAAMRPHQTGIRMGVTLSCLTGSWLVFPRQGDVSSLLQLMIVPSLGLGESLGSEQLSAAGAQGLGCL